jgi:hypothetical protein
MRYRGAWLLALAGSVLVVAMAAVLRAPDRTRADASQAAVGCSTTSSTFLEDVCARLGGAGSWHQAAVAATQIGPTPAMYARLAAAIRDRDETVCEDPTTVTFIQAGAHLDAAAATAMCHTYVTQALGVGSFSVPDPATSESITVEVQP